LTATTTDRATKESFNAGLGRPIPLTASTKIPGGVMVMVVAGTGTALNGADTANGVLMGISTQLVDTTLGHTSCPYKKGRFWLGNNGNITAANIGQQATIVDNQTVGLAADTTNDVIAGLILDVNATDGVLLDMTGSKIGAT
jgi:hypothetical protein